MVSRSQEIIAFCLMDRILAVDVDVLNLTAIRNQTNKLLTNN